MIKTFVKKPIVIEAIQFLGDNAEECASFVSPCKNAYFTNSDGTIIKYIYCARDVLSVLVGDWITKEDGEIFVYKDTLFNKLHDLVSDKEEQFDEKI